MQRFFTQICDKTEVVVIVQYDSINAYASFYIVGYLLELLMESDNIIRNM
jgi:hypothetical protein